MLSIQQTLVALQGLTDLTTQEDVRDVVSTLHRTDRKPELVTMLFEALNKFVMENRLYQQYSFEEIFKNLAVLTLRGICTDKGLKLLDKLL